MKDQRKKYFHIEEGEDQSDRRQIRQQNLTNKVQSLGPIGTEHQVNMEELTGKCRESKGQNVNRDALCSHHF